MKPDLTLTVLKEFDEKDFIRDLAICLSGKKSAPNDILTCQFGEVQEVEKEYLVVKAKTDISYTCLVGVDRKEVYYEDVKKYNSSTKSYYYEKQQKTRTVTDWSPHSGTASDEGIATVGNADDQSEYRHHYAFMNAYRASNEHKKWEAVENREEWPDVNPAALGEAEELHKKLLFNSVRLPGNHQKDESYTGTVDVKRKTIAKMPEFDTTYEYNGQTYKASGFASGSVEATAQAPTEFGYGTIEEQAKKSVKKLKYAAIGLFVLGFVLFILFLALDLAWGAVFYVAGIVAAIVCTVLYFKKRDEKTKQIKRDNNQTKKQALVEFLEKNGMAPLTEGESRQIDNAI